MKSPEKRPFSLQELAEDHLRWPDFVRCLEETAPEQAPFVLGDYARHLPCCLCVAFQDDQIVGFLRFGVQPVGAEEQCPPLVLNGVTLTEAKIHAFAVHPERRGQGIGTALQRLRAGEERQPLRQAFPRVQRPAGDARRPAEHPLPDAPSGAIIVSEVADGAGATLKRP